MQWIRVKRIFKYLAKDIYNELRKTWKMLLVLCYYFLKPILLRNRQFSANEVIKIHILIFILEKKSQKHFSRKKIMVSLAIWYISGKNTPIMNSTLKRENPQMAFKLPGTTKKKKKKTTLKCSHCMRKCVCIYIFVQKEKQNKPETNEIGKPQGMSGSEAGGGRGWVECNTRDEGYFQEQSWPSEL